MSKAHLLVTGAAGFIGARFVERCNQLKNFSILSVDSPPYFKARPEHAGLDFGQIIDRSNLFEILASGVHQIDAIFHLGACTDTTEFNVAYLNKMNLEYSKQLWTYAVKNQIPFIYASSAATYGDGTLGYDDDETQISKLKPLNPYGQSKQDFDVWALAQETVGATPPTWAGFKFFNVYGFGERHKEKMASVVLHAYEQIRTTEKVRLFRSHRTGIADGQQARDFIYVEDVVDVLQFALAKPIRRGIFNLGSGKARTFLDLVRGVFKSMKLQEQIEFIDTPLEIRDKYQYFTEAKMQKLKSEGFSKTFTSLEDGIDRYVHQLIEELK